MIGGSGEKKTLRMVAQYADASNFFGDADRIRHLVGVLDEHCERLGRDRAEITTTGLSTLVIGHNAEHAEAKLNFLRQLPGVTERTLAAVSAGDPDTIAERASGLVDAGLDGLIFNMPDAHDLETIALAGETLAPVLAARAG